MHAHEETGLHDSYGESRIIEDVRLHIAHNESLALMGRNGMGKTTLIKALIGLLPIDRGAVRVGNAEVGCLACH